MDSENRAALIRLALMEKAGQSVNMFTADDILTVAGITAEQIEAFALQEEQAAGRLSGAGEE